MQPEKIRIGRCGYRVWFSASLLRVMHRCAPSSSASSSGEGVKILVCGSRHWTKRAPIEAQLRRLAPGDVVVHGAHWQGADAIADVVARELGLVVRRYPAEWSKYGRSAGPRRNAQMLKEEHHPPKDPIECYLAFAEDFSVAFGTSDMRRKCEAAGIHGESFSS